MSPYKTFWMGGFEGADHVNAQEQRLDMVRDSGHLANVDRHYAKLVKLGILTVRESIGWRSVQPSIASTYNWNRVTSRAKAAQRHGIQVVWTFMHYGVPLGVQLDDDSFIEEFACYAYECASILKQYDDAPVINLINEISFLAWAVSQSDHVWPFHPSTSEFGFAVKCRLVKAVLRGIEQVREVLPNARFLHVEPLLHVVAPQDRPDLEGLAREVRDHQWQTWDLLKGSMEPQLGGHPEALDLMGVNHYYNGQMEVVTDKHLAWDPPDERRVPFSALLREVWERYERPLIISETGHYDADRHRWIDSILSEVQAALNDGVPLDGLCIYPIIDRPCWHEPNKIIRCGLLDHLSSLKTYRRWQKRLESSS